ncbi:DUF2922 family protein [Enterococcus massiliensis]|uniref:DUF2922 family protein n=1 Tax=Enterococcus massiliensis TaxID=1640685 RepID=UPI00065E8AB5|nr:DUF2922 family protein [Enterococcus massiliensis]
MRYYLDTKIELLFQNGRGQLFKQGMNDVIKGPTEEALHRWTELCQRLMPSEFAAVAVIETTRKIQKLAKEEDYLEKVKLRNFRREGDARKKLSLTFLDGNNRPHTFMPIACREDLTEAEVREIMTEMTKVKLFEKEGVRRFCYMESAKYVEQEEQILFEIKDLKKDSTEKGVFKTRGEKNSS